MAAHITQRLYSLCRSVGISVTPQRVKVNIVRVKDINHMLQPSISYVTGEADTTQNKNRINKAGELLVTSELSRSQQRNLSDCIQKISAIIAEASKKPHEPTAEDVALRAARLEKRNKERLKQKKINSATKQSRRIDFD
ncbi:Peptidyl-tRNA hydrolase ICT1, mitochondrial [Channa argus]|uniref:Peptidyl-tRNA hydrolase ICT1, mitochondrial n=1 Tax=Channa argus TaxID=215402 RepID=A0A6G1QPQ2_CHAAH|nr:Peptidyl-tRNA hydrolase ICT1, mitochondrial [Channa argus]